MPKILVRLCVPLTGGQTEDSRMMIEKFKLAEITNIEFQVHTINETYCSLQARNKLIHDTTNDPNNWSNYGRYRKDWKAPYDYLMMSDNDIFFTVKSVCNMIYISQQINDNAILAGAYLNRWNKEWITFGDQIESGHNHCLRTDEYLKITTFPHQVAWAGNGMMLFPKKILNQFPVPVYQHREYKDSQERIGWYIDDQCLALSCKELGIPIYLTKERAIHRGMAI